MSVFPIPDRLIKVTFPIWNGPAPLSRGNAPHDVPSLTPFFPENAMDPSPAMLICPGGGYVEMAFDRGMIDFAEHFQKKGMAVFLLRYRLASDGYRYPAQLLDAQRALRLIRARATDWKIDSTRITALGFSAGGHLASMLETHSDNGDPLAADPVDRQSSRPDAAVLVYPVISFVGKFAKAGTSMNLLDPDPDPALLEQISSDTQVRPDMPPTLLVHTEDDQTVSIDHSRAMYATLRKAGIPSAFHEYPSGKHGFGCWAGDASPSGWMERMEEWLNGLGLIS